MRRKIATSLRRLAGRIDPSPVSVSVSIVHIDGRAVAWAVAAAKKAYKLRPYYRYEQVRPMDDSLYPSN